MDGYQEYRFRQQVDKAIANVKKVLDNTRNPTFPADVPHRYLDKYVAAEFIIKAAAASQLQSLLVLGLTADKLAQLVELSDNQHVTLRLKAEERCKFVEMKEEVVEDPVKHVTKIGALKISSGVQTKVKNYFHDVSVAYQLIAFSGPAPTQENTVVLQQRQATVTIKTGSEDLPRPKVSVRPSIDVNITWLLQRARGPVSFTIDRQHKDCHTPRRNPEVDAALRYMRDFFNWCGRMSGYIRGLFNIKGDHGRDLTALQSNTVFCPVVPLFEDMSQRAIEDQTMEAEGMILADHTVHDEPSQVMLPLGDVNLFLMEEVRSLAEKVKELSVAFPADGSLVSRQEAILVVVASHIRTVCQHMSDGVDYIEDLLRKGVIAAIGKEVSPMDFAAYMVFHNRKLFKPEFAPRPFCYAIRRPDHYPEGTLSIESLTEGSAIPQPVPTQVRKIENGRPMSFDINAATRITFHGERYLHGMILHSFQGSQPAPLTLACRARQFSSFIVLVGKIASATLFEPVSALLVSNKDDVKIPLMLEQIPTPKEFADAIESLSPEQQAFCKAFRAMQLEATLFGVLVLQVKPQLERLLQLPEDSLTKEIQLTQDLQELFVTYQIPSDLLKFDGDEETPAADKLAVVKRSVATMKEMINESKDEQIADKQQEREYARPAKDVLTVSVKSFSSRKKSKQRKGDGAAHHSLSSKSSAMSAGPVAESISAPEPASTKEPLIPEVPEDGVVDVAQDVTLLPGLLDKMVLKLDSDSALRPTIITAGMRWERRACKSLLSEPHTENLHSDRQLTEKNTAFDFLDALSRSGSLPIQEASLHVLVAATHCFDKTVLETLVKDNVNPIEKVERSALIVGSAVHGEAPAAMVQPSHASRVSGLLK